MSKYTRRHYEDVASRKEEGGQAHLQIEQEDVGYGSVIHDDEMDVMTMKDYKIRKNLGIAAKNYAAVAGYKIEDFLAPQNKKGNRLDL